MKNIFLVALVISCAACLTGCAVGTAGSSASEDEYGPGYTGYTVMNQDYGISNGYGPAFWSPRYKYYTGYTQVSGEKGFYGHGGYHR